MFVAWGMTASGQPLGGPGVHFAAPVCHVVPVCSALYSAPTVSFDAVLSFLAMNAALVAVNLNAFLVGVRTHPPLIPARPHGP